MGQGESRVHVSVCVYERERVSLGRADFRGEVCGVCIQWDTWILK